LFDATGGFKSFSDAGQMWYYGDKAALEAGPINHGSGPGFTLTGSVEDVAAPASLSVVQRDVYSDGTYDGTPSLVLPSGIAAGNTLVIVCRIGKSTAVDLSTYDASLTLEASDVVSDSSGLYVFSAETDGTEGGTTLGFTTSFSANSAFAVFEIAGTGHQIEATFAASLDPPSITPTGGSAETILIPVVSCRLANNSVDSAPSGYANLQSVQSAPGSTSGNACTLGTADRQATVTSEDPGTFGTTSITSGIVSATIAVR
jgi:hypothetical protein